MITWSHDSRDQRAASNLHVLDAVIVCVLVTLVANAIVVSVLLTGVRREDAVVLVGQKLP